MKSIIVILFICANLIACGRNKCPRYFYVPAQLSPAKSEFNVGDTITVTSTFHRELIGYTNEHEDLGFFDLGNVTFKPVTFIYVIDQDSSEEISVLSEAFDFIEDANYDYEEALYTEGSALIGEYNFENDSFDLSYSLVALKPGLYYHEFGSWIAFGDPKFPGKCLGDIYVYMSINNDLDGNIELLSESPNWFYNTWIPQDAKSRFYDMGGYVFRIMP